MNEFFHVGIFRNQVSYLLLLGNDMINNYILLFEMTGYCDKQKDTIKEYNYHRSARTIPAAMDRR